MLKESPFLAVVVNLNFAPRVWKRLIEEEKDGFTEKTTRLDFSYQLGAT